MLELQAALTGAVGDRLHAAVKFVPRTVEHDLGDPRFLGPRRQLLADRQRTLGLLSRLGLEVADREQRPIAQIIYDLGVDVLERAAYDQARTICRALDPLAYAQMPAVPLLGARLRFVNRAHYLPP